MVYALSVNKNIHAYNLYIHNVKLNLLLLIVQLEVALN